MTIPDRSDVPAPRRSPAARGGLVLVALLFMGATAWLMAARWTGSEDLTTRSEETLLPVELAEAAPAGTFRTKRAYTGRVEARREAELAFERAARLTRVFVREGDRVGAGQPLAQLDARDLELTANRFEAQAQQARALLAEFRAGPRAESIGAARARVAEIERRVELAGLQSARRRELVARQAISREELDRFDLESQSLAGGLDAARAQLDELLAGTRAELAGTRAEQVSAQEAAVASVEASLASLRLDVEKSTLRAPFAGRIAARLLDEGAFVAPGQPALRIVEDGRPEARIGLPAGEAAAIRPGEFFQVEAGGRKWRARALAVLPELDPQTRTSTLRLELPGEAAGQTLPGQIARLELDREEETAGFWLPLQALTRAERGLWACFVAVPAESPGAPEGSLRLERRQVEILHTEAGRALVRGPVKAGERVAVSGANRVAPGQLVIAGRPPAGI